MLDEPFDISNSFDISKLKEKEVSVTKYVMNRELCYTRIYIVKQRSHKNVARHVSFCPIVVYYQNIGITCLYCIQFVMVKNRKL